MSEFLDRFRPDPELPDLRRLWRTAKPLLRDAVVTYAPFDPDFPKLKVSRSRGPSRDPSCPSARDVGDEIDVMLYSHTDTFGEPQERAWGYILEHARPIEVALRRKLFARHLRYLRQLLDEELPGAKHLQRYWKAIEGKLEWDDPSAVDHLFKLVGVGLADSGLDDCGFSSFEFQTGWDRDHGLEILMHRDRVLAVGGMDELIGSRHDMVEVVKYVQQYDRDEGDFALLDG